MQQVWGRRVRLLISSINRSLLMWLVTSLKAEVVVEFVNGGVKQFLIKGEGDVNGFCLIGSLGEEEGDFVKL